MDRKPRTPEEILEYRKRWFRLTGIIAVTMWLGWFVLAVLLAFFKADEPITRFGQVGDAFGSLNAIFGGAGFLGLLYTIYRQHLDTLEAEQRRRDDKKGEDSVRREEQERHREAVAAQERIARISSYTSLLNGYQSLSQEIRAKASMINRLMNYSQDVINNYLCKGERTLSKNLSSLIAESALHLNTSEHAELCHLHEKFTNAREVLSRANDDDRDSEAFRPYDESYLELADYLLSIASQTATYEEASSALILRYREALLDETTTSKRAEDAAPAPAAE